MHLYSEHRLIYRKVRATTVNAKGRIVSLASPVGTNKRSAKANAAKQNTTYRNTLAKNQANADRFTYLDSNDGVDNRFRDADGNDTRQKYADGSFVPNSGIMGTAPLKTPSGIVDTSKLTRLENAGVYETQQEFEARKADIEAQNTEKMKQREIAQNAANDRAAASAASGAAVSSAMSLAQTAGEPGSKSLTDGNRFQGPSDAAPDRQSFIESQRAAGKSDAEIRQMINTLPPEQTGGGAMGPSSIQMKTSAPIPDDVKNRTMPAGPSKGTPTAEGTPAVDPSSGFLRNIAATVEDPIMQAILMAEADRADAAMPTDPEMSYGEFAGGEEGKALAKPYDAIDRILQNADKRAQQTFNSQKDFLKGQYERNEKLNALKEESIKQQLEFSNHKAVRDQTDANKKRLDSETIMLALQGGFGSADGNREVAEARLEGERAIIDLNKEFGFKHTDVSLAFTEMNNQAFDNYQSAWLTATDNFESKVADLDLDGIANQQAKSNAISGAYGDYVKEIKEARKEHATIISSATKMVYDAVNEERSNKRAQEELGWNILNQAIDNYGSMVPKSIIDRVSSMLPPGTDIMDVINTPTFAERNSKRISGGGGSMISFSTSEMRSDGSPIGFEDFVKQRQAEIKALPNLSLEDVKKATDLKTLRAEYDAKKSQFSQADPSEIVLRLEDRIKNSPKNVRENAQATVQKYLQAGNYVEADRYVDGLGSPLSATERGDMVQALNARKNVLRIQELLEEFGQQGPITGRLRDANLWGVKEKELNALVKQTVPGLARGIFKEVGVLTEDDIANYTETIPNSKSTVEQSRALTDQLLQTINMSIENQLAVMRDSGLNTRDLRTRFEETRTATATPSTLAPSQQAWLDSL